MPFRRIGCAATYGPIATIGVLTVREILCLFELQLLVTAPCRDLDR